MNKEDAKRQLTGLIQKYSNEKKELRPSGSDYNESQLRSDYLDPLLKIFGWDVDNEQGDPQHLRQVKQEESIEFDHEGATTQKQPDYTLRIAGNRRLFVEAKKPSVRIETDRGAAYQVRQYGWNAGLDISVLSNFHHLVLYDCRYQPEVSDSEHVARIREFEHTDYIKHFDELWDRLSYENVSSGGYKLADDDEPTGKQFDDFFLSQIETWRETLAADLYHQDPTLSEDELNFCSQRLINRIVFLRICEDREIETYERLREVDSHSGLKELFEDADEMYNSGLFNFIEGELSLTIEATGDSLREVFEELYYPNSPYNFSIVESGILGQIYDLFLGREVRVRNGDVSVKEKPEVVASGGVVPTPPFIARDIVAKTIAPLCKGKSPNEVTDLRICDACCGSGGFLLEAFEYLLNYHREWYIENGASRFPERITRGPGDRYKLTLREKKRILQNSIYGVDLDERAVEVTRFSLLLKVLENESFSTVNGYTKRYNEKPLPSLKSNIVLGNSLIDSTYFREADDVFEDADFEEILPFDWSDEFPDAFEKGGFDAVVGNPPYVRIQNLIEHTPKEVEFYRRDNSPYRSAEQDNFDKYYLFFERALSLLNSKGRLGFIAPHKFLTIKAGKPLRCLISEGDHLRSITNFGVEQVFPKRTTYTAIFSLTRSSNETFEVERVDDLEEWQVGKDFPYRKFSCDYIGCDPWIFVSSDAQRLFEKVQESPKTVELGKVAEIPVGLQNSANRIYIIRESYDYRLTQADDGTELIRFQKSGETWEIEKEIARPGLYKADVDPFEKPEENAWMIFPYEVQNGSATLYMEDEMIDRFPRCWEYLKAHREKLEGRDIRPGPNGLTKWYQYGRSQSLTKFDGSEKLIWSTLANRTPYAYDDSGLTITGGGNGPYYQLRPRQNTEVEMLRGEKYSIFYLLAVISDPILEAMVNARGSDFRGGYYSHGKQFIETLPIRALDLENPAEKQLHDQIAALSKDLILAVEKHKKASVPTSKKAQRDAITEKRLRLTEKIASAYGFSKDDYATVTKENLFLSTPSAEEEDDKDARDRLGSLSSFLLRSSKEIQKLNLVQSHKPEVN